jgi:hypothetical protein
MRPPQAIEALMLHALALPPESRPEAPIPRARMGLGQLLDAGASRHIL